MYHLGDGIKVRKESWGLLFFSKINDKVYFIKTNNWLLPHHFDGKWDYESIIDDIAKRTKLPEYDIKERISKLFQYLIEHKIIKDELY